jgi:hypothetical protein
MSFEPLRPRRFPRTSTLITWAIGALVLLTAVVITASQVMSGPERTGPSAAPTSSAFSVALPAAVASPAVPTSAPALTSSAPAAARIAIPPGRSVKKGVSTWDFAGVGAAMRDVGASWYYNWSAGATAGAGTSAQFVPMIWGSGSVTSANLAKAKAAGPVLLGFNEPDLAGQANLTVAAALDLWPQLQATGSRLGSPAVASGGATAGGWLDQFLAGARQRGYRVDFITLHWYGSDFSGAATSQLRGYLQAVYDRYHLPIWLTEYALIKFGDPSTYPTGAQQAAFIAASTAMLESSPFVERYAWFALPTSKSGDATGLYRDGSTPTAAGAAYRAVS